MAVVTSSVVEREPMYVGCVLDTFERNGSWDSDFYAVVWDAEKQEVRNIEYDTTRFAGGGWAKIDATKETVLQVYRHYKKEAKKSFDEFSNPRQAKEIKKGDTVRIVKGYKVKKGTVCTVFWAGKRWNCYSRMNEDRLGVEVNGERVFIAAENAEVIDWESRLITGKNRKEAIRTSALARMPYRYRDFFKRKVW